MLLLSRGRIQSWGTGLGHLLQRLGCTIIAGRTWTYPVGLADPFPSPAIEIRGHLLASQPFPGVIWAFGSAAQASIMYKCSG